MWLLRTLSKYVFNWTDSYCSWRKMRKEPSSILKWWRELKNINRLLKKMKDPSLLLEILWDRLNWAEWSKGFNHSSRTQIRLSTWWIRCSHKNLILVGKMIWNSWICILTKFRTVFSNLENQKGISVLFRDHLVYLKVYNTGWTVWWAKNRSNSLLSYIVKEIFFYYKTGINLTPILQFSMKFKH